MDAHDSRALFAVLYGIKGLGGKHTNAVEIGNEQDSRSRRRKRCPDPDSGRQWTVRLWGVRYWADGREGRADSFAVAIQLAGQTKK